MKVKFSDVKIRYSNAENAARQIVIEEAGEIKKPEIEIFIKDNRLIVNNKGGQLFLALSHFFQYKQKKINFIMIILTFKNQENNGHILLTIKL